MIYEKPNAEKILLTALEAITDASGEGVEGSDNVPSQKRPG